MIPPVALYLFYLCRLSKISKEHSCLLLRPILYKTSPVLSGTAICSASYTWYTQGITNICSKTFSLSVKSSRARPHLLLPSAVHDSWNIINDSSLFPSKQINWKRYMCSSQKHNDLSTSFFIFIFCPSSIILFIHVAQVKLLFPVPLAYGVPDLFIPLPRNFHVNLLARFPSL